MIACVPTPFSHRWRMGMPKAAVLPVPVRAWPSRSTPARARGISRSWISEGVVNFASARARRMEGRTPRAANASGTGGCSVLSLMLLFREGVPRRLGVGACVNGTSQMAYVANDENGFYGARGLGSTCAAVEEAKGRARGGDFSARVRCQRHHAGRVGRPAQGQEDVGE